jgi:2-C-methyl-D-erythritol 4-phosphate cytidylyltransferase
MKKFALIVAGGSGNRMNNAVPKQFIEINDRPVLMHTFDAFLKFDSNLEFILVLPKDQIKLWKSLCKKHGFQLKHKIAYGGETRFQSVKNGLDLISDDGIVFIHDGVRPLVSAKTLQNCLEMAAEQGNALPVIQVTESVRIMEGTGNRAVDRSKYYLVQTPQTFDCGLIKEAFNRSKTILFNDDATVLESMGERIHLVAGNRENIKITYPEDLVFAKSFLSLR